MKKSQRPSSRDIYIEILRLAENGTGDYETSPQTRHVSFDFDLRGEKFILGDVTKDPDNFVVCDITYRGRLELQRLLDERKTSGLWWNAWKVILFVAGTTAAAWIASLFK